MKQLILTPASKVKNTLKVPIIFYPFRDICDFQKYCKVIVIYNGTEFELPTSLDNNDTTILEVE